MNPNQINPSDFAKYLDDTGFMESLQPTHDFIEEAINSFYSEEIISGDKMAFPSLKNRLSFRPGEVTIWAGYNGHGKSMFLGQVMMQMIYPNLRKVCFASMEMKPYRTLNRMARQYLGEIVPKKELLRDYYETIGDYTWFYNIQGVAQAKHIIACMKYCANELGINHFVIDSLMKCGLDEDDFNSQKKFIDHLCTIARDTGMHIHLVCHSRKGKDELTPPGKMDIRGSGTITDQVDNVITVWRNKDKNRPMGEDAVLLVDKQRNGEWDGAVSFRFCPISQSYSETYPDQ